MKYLTIYDVIDIKYLWGNATVFLNILAEKSFSGGFSARDEGKSSTLYFAKIFQIPNEIKQHLGSRVKWRVLLPRSAAE